MAIKARYLAPPVVEDLQEKMVFVGGPRQVGKTTLSQALVAGHFKAAAYYNWDLREDRRKVLEGNWPGDAELLILDEIHKYRAWKRLLKGAYDTQKARYKFLVTGSARLDVFRRGGDSLQGRYHYYRLHPFSLAELLGHSPRVEPGKELSVEPRFQSEDLAQLDIFGGFPEPLFKQDARTLRRWQAERNERLFREDIRDVQMIRDLGTMQLLGDLLPAKVGSLFSLNAIREDLEVSYKALVHWMDLFETFYFAYRLYPLARGPIRSLKKGPKLYLWDWSEIKDEAARFENLMAGHLLKTAHFLHDREGYKVDLRYLRDTAGREVDFIVLFEEKPWFAVEVKLNATEIDRSLRYFKERLAIPFVYQVVKKSGVDRWINGVRLVSADRFLTALL